MTKIIVGPSSALRPARQISTTLYADRTMIGILFINTEGLFEEVKGS